MGVLSMQQHGSGEKIDLDALFLGRGSHASREDGVCLMEVVAWLAGEPHTDSPACTHPALATYGRELNDALGDNIRQRLRPLAPRLVGTAGIEDLEQRVGLIAVDWIVRTCTPTWLRLSGLEGEAPALEGLPEIRSWDDLEAATPALRAAEN